MTLEFEIFVLSIITIVGSIIWNTINTILNIKNHRRTNIVLNIPAKKRLFKKLYELIKDLTNRMVFTGTLKGNNYVVYFFKVKTIDSKGFISSEEQRILQNRIIDCYDELNNICKIKYKTVNNTPEEKWENLYQIDVQVCYESITVPSDNVPENNEQVKVLLRERTRMRAKENGVKLK